MVREAAKRVVIALPRENVSADIVGAPSRIYANWWAECETQTHHRLTNEEGCIGVGSTIFGSQLGTAADILRPSNQAARRNPVTYMSRTAVGLSL
jgi:hypothetical protein